MSPRALLIAAGLIAAGCAAAQRGAPTPASDPSIRYTLVNLHPDEGRLRLYTVNFQQPG